MRKALSQRDLYSAFARFVVDARSAALAFLGAKPLLRASSSRGCLPLVRFVLSLGGSVFLSVKEGSGSVASVRRAPRHLSSVARTLPNHHVRFRGDRVQPNQNRRRAPICHGPSIDPGARRTRQSFCRSCCPFRCSQKKTAGSELPRESPDPDAVHSAAPKRSMCQRERALWARRSQAITRPEGIPGMTASVNPSPKTEPAMDKSVVSMTAAMPGAQRSHTR